MKKIERVHGLMEELGIDALLIEKSENRYYLSGFTGTAGRILFTEKKDYFLTDFRYTEQAAEETEGFEILQINSAFEERLNELLQENRVKRMGFEAAFISYEQYLKYRDNLEAELVETRNLIERMRMVKDQAEIEKIRKAVEITDQAFEHILGFIRPGISEREIALELEFFLKKKGAERNAFDFIIASGKRSSLPHGVATEKKIEYGDLLTMDFGIFYQGYCSDLTRTVVVGEATARQREIYNIVLKAQLEVIEKVRAGMGCREADAIARDIIAEAGFRENFGHGLGHGIGLEIHEGPRVSFTSEDILEKGMVVTNEPGIYLPEWGGVRIEDDLLITDTACEVLNKAEKTLIEISI
ncbi:MAG: aminopeptidase P family protein [Halanaerobiaceae bacterium]|nr:aminopeptidase P family protein [Halanaerobiaceae bacterium]